MKIARGTREPRLSKPATATYDHKSAGRAGSGIQRAPHDFWLAEKERLIQDVTGCETRCENFRKALRVVVSHGLM